MDAVIREMLLVVFSYVGVLLLGFGIINWLMSGKLVPFIKVKASRGKLLLVHIRTVTQDYFKIGVINDGFLTFKTRNKETKKIKINDNKALYRSGGVNNIVVDDENDTIFTRELNSIAGHDAVKTESLYLRCLYKPVLTTKQDKIVLALLVVAIIVGLACVYFGYQNNEILKVIQSVGSNAQVI